MSVILTYFYIETATKENKMILSSKHMILKQFYAGNLYNRP